MTMQRDRMVHARIATEDGIREVARYDREGRWYIEGPEGKRQRLGTVHEAAQAALDLEDQGGTVFLGRPGGKQFDAKVTGGHRKGTRR